MLIYFRLLVIIAFISSCCINEPYSSSNTGVIIASVSLDTLGFVLINYMDDNEEIVIINEQSYQLFIREKQQKYNCTLKQALAIDWEKQSLIGKKVINEYCNGYFERNAYWKNSTLVYEITKKSCGSCNSIVGSDNLVIVPKISNETKVKFVVK